MLTKKKENSKMQEQNDNANNSKEDIKEVCDEIFYSKANDLSGSIGIKNLSTMMSMSDEEFEEYLNNL